MTAPDGMHGRALLTRRALSVLAILLLAPLLMLALLSFQQEMAVHAWTDRLARQHELLLHDAPAPPPPPIEAYAPARAHLMRALYLLRASQAASPEAVLPLQAQADGEIAALRGARRLWAEADLVAAYREQLRAQPRPAVLAAAIARSYEGASYLKDSARFRIDLGLAVWSDLPRLAQARLIDEAIWYVRLRPAEKPAIFASMRDSAAYTLFMLRWYAVRRLDADWGAGRAPRPSPPEIASH